MIIMADKMLFVQTSGIDTLERPELGADVVNSLDCDALVEAMYGPAGNREVVEDVLLRVLSRGGSILKQMP
jgi:hypothetical protein